MIETNQFVYAERGSNKIELPITFGPNKTGKRIKRVNPGEVPYHFHVWESSWEHRLCPLSKKTTNNGQSLTRSSCKDVHSHVLHKNHARQLILDHVITSMFVFQWMLSKQETKAPTLTVNPSYVPYFGAPIVLTNSLRSVNV